ncbi:hypothetical protein NGM10_03860 [Halorussus salilacus]|uniref:hypothetical protein n=1 Tax=Halorussus salilacus TaxID=2953750 RepID=UPI00209FEEF8|nr:hypothetical protein [Halorussus salilacus]USZ68876.1 hypothetical protein NGM10_03860 [Halorussus salilacus]
MDLTLVAASSVLFVGVGYAFVRRARRSRVVVWALVCASLFALSTRDLFRSRERSRPGRTPSDGRSDRSAGRADATDDGSRPPLVARLRRRVGGWFG